MWTGNQIWVSLFFLINLLNAINEYFPLHGHLVIRTVSMLVSLRSALIFALARILGKMLELAPAYALYNLFNCYFSTLQSPVYFAIILCMLSLVQTSIHALLAS